MNLQAGVFSGDESQMNTGLNFAANGNSPLSLISQKGTDCVFNLFSKVEALLRHPHTRCLILVQAPGVRMQCCVVFSQMIVNCSCFGTRVILTLVRILPLHSC